MFGVSGTELFFIVVFALIVFGPDKLPQMGRTIGRFMREFKRYQDNMETMLRTELYAADKPDVDKSVAGVASVPSTEDISPAPSAYGDDADDEEEDEE